MKKLLFAITTLFCFQSYAQINHLLTGSNGEIITVRSVSSTSDNETIAGLDISIPSGVTSAILKLNSLGDIEWSKELIFQDEDASCSYDVIQNSQGNYLVHGLMMKLAGQYAFVIEVSPTGNIVFAKEYHLGGTSVYSVNRLNIADDGSMYLYCSQYDQVTIIHTDNQGNSIWARGISNDMGAGGKNPGFDFDIRPDGSVVGCGKNNNSLSILNFDATGNMTWTKSLYVGGSNGSGYIHAKTMALDDNGDIIISGNMMDSLFFSEYTVVFKLNGNTGDVIWAKTLDNVYPSWTYQEVVVKNGEIHISLSAYEQQFVELNHYLINLDLDGNALPSFISNSAVTPMDYNRISLNDGFTYRYGTTGNGTTTEGLIVKEEVMNGCYFNPFELTISEMTSYSNDTVSVFVVNNLTVGQNTSVTLSDITINTSEFCSELSITPVLNNEISFSPNPSNGLFTNTSSLNLSGNLTVLDINGRIVLSTDYGPINTIDLRSAQPGVYYYRFSGNGKVLQGKLIVN